MAYLYFSDEECSTDVTSTLMNREECGEKHDSKFFLFLLFCFYTGVGGDVKIQQLRPSVCHSQSPPAATEWLQHSYMEVFNHN